MAKLKRMASIRNWDFLDDFYGYKVKGLNIKLVGFERGFCSCGHVHTSFVDKCENCGNFSFLKVINEQLYQDRPRVTFDKGDTIDKKYTCHHNTDDKGFYFSIQYHDYKFVEDKNGDVTFSEYTKEIFKMYKDRLITNIEISKDETCDYFRINFHDLKNALSNGYGDYINDYFETHCQVLMDSNFEILKYFPTREDFLQREKTYPYVSSYWNNIDFYKEDISPLCKTVIGVYAAICYNGLFTNATALQFPNILKALLTDALVDNFYYLPYSYDRDINYPVKSLDDLIFTNGRYEAMEFVAKEEVSLSAILGEPYNHLNIYRRNHLNLKYFYENMDSKKTGLEDIILHYVNNGMISYFEGNLIFYNINGMSDYMKDLFKIYLKENVFYKKTNIYQEFIEQVEFMTDNDILLTEENFKIKNYNNLINHKILADKYRLPVEKAECFLDMFEYSPLDAMELVSNRRKLSKKEQDAFLDKIFKKI